LVAEGKVSGLDSKVDRMESGGEIGERCPLLNTSRGSSRPSSERCMRYQNGNKPSAEKGKRQPPYEERRVAALSEKGRSPKTEGSRRSRSLSRRSIVPIWIKGIRRASLFAVPGSHIARGSRRLYRSRLVLTLFGSLGPRVHLGSGQRLHRVT